MTRLAIGFVLLFASAAFAQESRLASDLRREREHIAANCDDLAAKALASCAVTLITDYPFHLALGNLAPKNGFAFGLAFSERYTPNEDWRISFNADAVGATTGSWRTGGYVTFIRTKVTLPTVGTGAVASSASNSLHEYPVFRVHIQRSVLNHLVDFGPDFDQPLETTFGETQTILGGSAVVPLSFLGRAAVSVVGGMQGRFISIYDSSAGDTFTEVFGDVRLKPSLAGDHVRLNYTGRLQKFLADTPNTFHRWTVDLRHEIPLYRRVASTGPNEFNGPNDCGTSPTTRSCPPLTFSRNLNGTIGFRLLAISSAASDPNGAVPFYLQPTIGGSDINNQRLLSSYDDYRFRAPHVIALQASIEHSVWGPLGGFLMAERGKAVHERSALDFNDLLSTYAAGLTLRAGGAPVLTASYGWNSAGHRFIVNMDSSLLGGSSRPSLH